MSTSQSSARKLYAGMHDGVCALLESGGKDCWSQGPVTPLQHAASRFSWSNANPQRAYLAAYESGVYRTDDGGQTWRNLPSYPTSYAHSVLADSLDADTLYVGSEPADVFRSCDGGETWESCPGFRAVPESSQWSFHSETRDSHVRDLRTTPHDAGILYAGIEVGGVIRSTDGGRSWEQCTGPDPDIHCINPAPSLPGRVYIATARGPYRSDDGGRSWEPLDSGLSRTYTLHIASAYDNPDLVLVTVSRSAGRSEPQFYRSEDGGKRWGLVQEVGSLDDMVVAIDWDPEEPSRVYAGTDSGKIYCSSDRGCSWSQIPVELGTLAVGALVVAPVR